MNYLISGGTGFIGSHLIESISTESNHITLILRPDSHLSSDIEKKISSKFIFSGEINELDEFLSKNRPDIFIHLASLYITHHSKYDVQALTEANITYPTILIDSAIRSGCKKIINTGTSWQNINNENNNPACLYAATKAAFENILDFYARAYDVKIITLRLFDTYGPQDKRKKLVSSLIESIEKNLKIEMSPGDQEIDLVYIDDVIDAYVSTCEILTNPIHHLPPHSVYAVSSQNPITLKELVHSINLTFNTQLNVIWGARPYRMREVMETWKNYNLLPNWKPKIDLHNGLKKLID